MDHYRYPIGDAARMLVLASAAMMAGCMLSPQRLGAPRPNDERITLSPLMNAASLGEITDVERELDGGADVNEAAGDHSTALHHAATSYDVERVRLLLDHGAAVDARTKLDRTPLHYAAMHGRAENAVLLVERGANPNVTDADGLTALHYAAIAGSKPTVDALLERSATIVPVATSAEAAEATARIYSAASEREQDSRPDDARAARAQAADYFDKAAGLYAKDAAAVGRHVGWVKARSTAGTVGLALLAGAAGAVADAGSTYQANMQQRQMAQIQALRFANDHHLGPSGYFRAYDAIQAKQLPTNPIRSAVWTGGAIMPSTAGAESSNDLGALTAMKASYESRAQELKGLAAALRDGLAAAQ